MKRRFAIAALCVLLLAACGNPWMTGIVDGFFKKNQDGDVPLFTSVSQVLNYLAAQSGGVGQGNPVRLRMGIELSAGGWSGLLNAINTSGKYVSLDLSACTKSEGSTGGGLHSDGTFDPDNTSPGKGWIAGIILPEKATKIAGVFSSFTKLQNVSAAYVTNITSDWTFKILGDSYGTND